MSILQPTPNTLPQHGESHTISTPCLSLNLLQLPRRFFRHGWQSWALATWLDPRRPPVPVRAPEFRMKDEDPVYALASNHVSAWVTAVEVAADDIVLLGALGPGGRVELNGTTLHGFFELDRDGHHTAGEWFLARGKEDDVFCQYGRRLKEKLGKGRFDRAPRVWCSWYSLYKWVNERVFLKVLEDFGDMPFDVFQIDDGWQRSHGDWESNDKFPSGMAVIAEKIRETGRIPGIWLAPFMVSSNAKLAKDHPDWLLRNEEGIPIPVGISWSGHPWGLDVSQPEVLEWLEGLIRKVRGWGYGYLKLDFLYIGALIGKRYKDISREVAYRNAMQRIREAAGDAYILACGAPIIPSLGLCDGLRVGPDVAPFWLNRPLSVWLNNPNDTSTQNAIRTSVHRLWLDQVVNVDPDVVFFRSKYNGLKPHERQMLQDLATISDFRATSDLPQWLDASEAKQLRLFLESARAVQKKQRYVYQIEGRAVDFNPAIPLPVSTTRIPIWLAKKLGLLKIILRKALPAIFESKKL